jgi:hypothetical protein
MKTELDKEKVTYTKPILIKEGEKHLSEEWFNYQMTQQGDVYNKVLKITKKNKEKKEYRNLIAQAIIGFIICVLIGGGFLYFIDKILNENKL